jgi:hypothetical protein
VNRELHQHELELKAVRDERKHNLAAITMYGTPGSASGMTHEEQEGAKRHKWYEGWYITGLSSGPDPHATFEGGEIEGGEIEGVEMPSFDPSNQSHAVPVKEGWVNNDFAPKPNQDTYVAVWDPKARQRRFDIFSNAPQA